MLYAIEHLLQSVVWSRVQSQYTRVLILYAQAWSLSILSIACALQVQTMDYSCIVFDTAPTGHTLRLLQFPTTLQKGLSKLMSLKGMFGSMLNQLGALFGAGGGENMQDQLLGRLEQLKVSWSLALHV